MMGWSEYDCSDGQAILGGGEVNHIAKDCLLTLVKSRLALGSPGCSFVRSFVRHHAKNGPIHRKMVATAP